MGTGVHRACNFALMVIVARLLGKVGFGELGIVQSTIGAIGAFAGLGLSSTSLRYIAEFKDKDPEKSGRIIALLYTVSFAAGFLAMVICFSSASWLASGILHKPQLISALHIGSLLFMSSLVGGLQGGILIGFQDFRGLASVTILQTLLSFPVTVGLSLWAGLNGFVAALVVTSLLGLTICVPVIFRNLRGHRIKLQWREAWREHRTLYVFSLPAFLAGISHGPVMWIASTLLVRSPGGCAQMGLLNAALQFNMFVTMIATLFAQVATSLLSETYGESKDACRYARAFNLNLRLNWTWSIMVAFTVIIFSHAISAAYGVGFHLIGRILPLTIAFATANIGFSLCGQFFVSSDRMWLHLLVVSLWGLTFIGVFYFILLPLGAKGCAIALLIAYFIAVVLQLLMINNFLGRGILDGIIINCGLVAILSLAAIGLSFGKSVGIWQAMSAVGALLTFGKFAVSDVRVAFPSLRWHAVWQERGSFLRAYCKNLDQ